MLQLILLLAFNLFAQAPAESKPSLPVVKTSDLVIVSGGQSHERIKPDQLLTIEGQKGYIIRSFLLNSRANVNMPQDFHIWSRGMGDVYFFEWPAATDPAKTNNDANASHLISALRLNGLLSPLLRVNVLSDQPKLIGYLQRVDAANNGRVGGEIVIAAKNAEPQTLPVELEVAQEEETLLSKMWAAVPTTLVGLVGTLGGAVIGYKFFLYQQRRLHQTELEKKFADKKVEMSKAIRKFFKDDYDGLRHSQDDDIEKVRQIRDTLIETDIYAILLPEEVQDVNKLSDRSQPVKGSRVDALHRVLEKNFAELMV